MVTLNVFELKNNLILQFLVRRKLLFKSVVYLIIKKA